VSFSATGAVVNAEVSSAVLEDAYEALGVSADTTDEEVTESYRKLARAAHPDQGGTDEAMAALSDAYALIRAARGNSENSMALRRTEIALGVGRDRVRHGELREDSQRAFEATLRHTTLRLKQAKRQSAWFALGSIGIGIVISLLKTFGLDIVSGPEAPRKPGSPQLLVSPLSAQAFSSAPYSRRRHGGRL
jgi:hypothetical protein